MPQKNKNKLLQKIGSYAYDWEFYDLTDKRKRPKKKNPFQRWCCEKIETNLENMSQIVHLHVYGLYTNLPLLCHINYPLLTQA